MYHSEDIWMSEWFSESPEKYLRFILKRFQPVYDFLKQLNSHEPRIFLPYISDTGLAFQVTEIRHLDIHSVQGIK